MKKISLAWYSYYGGQGYKASQMEYLIPALGENLCMCYGLKFPRHIDTSGYALDKMDLSRIPSIVAYITRKLSKIIPVSQILHYILGQRIFGMMYRRKLAVDDSEIVFLNCMPFDLVKSAKKAGKKVVVEAGFLHPQSTWELIENEVERLGINRRYESKVEKSFREEQINSLRYADIIIAVSDGVTESLIDHGISSKKIRTIPLIQTMANVPAVSKNMPYAFFCTATHALAKGTHILLEAWRKAEINGMPLILVGTLQRDLAEYIQLNGPFENVIYMGHQSIANIYSKYRGVGILMSLSEGSPRCVPEYMSFSFPVIVSPVSTASVVENEVNGFIVDPYDQERLVDCLRYFADYHEKIDEMGQKAYEQVKNKSIKDYAVGVAETLLE